MINNHHDTDANKRSHNLIVFSGDGHRSKADKLLQRYAAINLETDRQTRLDLLVPLHYDILDYIQQLPARPDSH